MNVRKIFKKNIPRMWSLKIYQTMNLKKQFYAAVVLLSLSFKDHKRMDSPMCSNEQNSKL